MPFRKLTIISAIALSISATISSAAPAPAQAAAAAVESPKRVLITNVNIFDGFSPELIANQSVLIEGNHIVEVGPALEASNAEVIDGEGRTLTPGLIDMHQHVMLNPPEGTAAYQTRWDEAAGGAFAIHHMEENMLMKGITTVRDIAGDPLDLAKAIDMGYLPGPRVYSSGGAISQTGGHGDWAGRNIASQDLHNHRDIAQASQNTWVVDGPDAVTRAVRMNMRRGAAFTKIMGGGGVASEFDPLEIMGLAQDEVDRAVEISADNGTYVATHAYHTASYNRLLDAGVRSFEHGFLIDEPTVKRMAKKYRKDKDIVWSFQCFMSINSFGDYDSMPAFFTHEQKVKGVAVGKGARNVSKWMNKHDMFVVGGSDMFTPGLVGRIKEDLTCNVKAGFSPAQALKHWTGNAGIVLKWSGPKDPYPTYALGTIKKDAYADILLWDGNPLENIELILDEDKLDLIMKDGKVYKNEL
ncbi:amidohydrolase family protein [Agaribacterium sp. ZY112]|uniref:metal-dependent hydrolase family protein n=1 Tax=Agaribacterium sp. ZY112 TaxID=3233574 RepID=UPI003524D3F5